MKLTTTLALIREQSPCASGWKTLLAHLGSDFDPNAEINLLIILESNGVADMLWCLRATAQGSKRVSTQLAIAFAEQVLPLFEKRSPDDQRPRQAIQAAKDHLDGKINRDELQVAREASADAAYAYAADAAADAAAYAAAYAATAAAAADAAAYAAYAAADAAAADAAAADAYAYGDARKAALEKQAEIIRAALQ